MLEKEVDEKYYITAKDLNDINKDKECFFGICTKEKKAVSVSEKRQKEDTQ